MGVLAIGNSVIDVLELFDSVRRYIFILGSWFKYTKSKQRWRPTKLCPESILTMLIFASRIVVDNSKPRMTKHSIYVCGLPTQIIALVLEC